MDEELVIKSAKEIYGAVSTYCEKSEDNSFGDWRVVKSSLKNGDLQVIIYRRITEINLVCNQLNKKKIEAFFKYNKISDGIIDKAVTSYVNDFNLEKPSGDITITTTIFFDDLEDFNVFVYKYLLADI